VITITVVQYITSNLQPNLSKYGGGGAGYGEKRLNGARCKVDVTAHIQYD